MQGDYGEYNIVLQIYSFEQYNDYNKMDSREIECGGDKKQVNNFHGLRRVDDHRNGKFD